jgi:hypothetical protein
MAQKGRTAALFKSLIRNSPSLHKIYSIELCHRRLRALTVKEVACRDRATALTCCALIELCHRRLIQSTYSTLVLYYAGRAKPGHRTD